MILVVSSTRDEHAMVVLQHLAAIGAPAELIDLSWFPQLIRLNISYGAAAKFDPRLTLPDGRTLDLSDVGAIWWRRPQSFEIDPSIRRPGHRTFAYNESHEAFTGLWLTLASHWVNHPSATETAARKPFQLRVAQEVGLTVPRTIITNDPDEARTFISCNPTATIYKSFSATQQEWRETRLLGQEELGLLNQLVHAPVIFQEYIRAAVDLRITIIGDSVFAAAIHSQQTSYPVDFRMDMSQARVESVSLEPAFEAGLRSLMGRLGLVYGAIDARLTPDGAYVFLEVNPAGQWVFIEQRTGQPMTETLAQYLSNVDSTEVGLALSVL